MRRAYKSRGAFVALDIELCRERKWLLGCMPILMSFDMDKRHLKVCESTDCLSDFVVHVIIVRNGVIGENLGQVCLFRCFRYCSSVVTVDYEVGP